MACSSVMWHDTNSERRPH